MTSTVIFQASADALALHEHLDFDACRRYRDLRPPWRRHRQACLRSIHVLRTARLIAQREDG